MFLNKKLCTKTVIGKVTKFRMMGGDSPSRITVSYVVDGVEYKITEGVSMKFEPIKAGPIIIGQRKISYISNLNEGADIEVCYNPDKPQKAYIKENIGKWS